MKAPLLHARGRKIVTAALLAIAAHASVAGSVVVGQVAPMTGLEARQGRDYGAGLQMYFDAVNKDGGVNGNTFTLVRKDDHGRPSETVALTRQMVAEDKPLVLAGYFGSRNVADVVATGLLENEHLALVGYRSAEIRDDMPMVYNVRASLRDELARITAHLATVGIRKLGLFYEDGPNAQELVAAADAAAKKVDASIVARASYAASTTKVGDAVEQFLKAKPQAIIMVSSGAAAGAFIEAYRGGGGTAQLLAHSGTELEQLSLRLGDEQMAGLVIAQVTPNPYRINGRLTKEFLDTAKAQKADAPVSYAMMEGYIAARVIVEAVRRQGARPTREGVVTALNGMDSFDLGGYSLAFKPTQRTGSHYVELSIVNSTGKIRQ